MEKKKGLIFFKKIHVILLSIVLLLTACVDQSRDDNQSVVETNTKIEEFNLVATSAATVEICNILELPLVGVPMTRSILPDRYQGIQTVGGAMGPDIEVILSLKPTEVLGPDTLEEQLKPRYQAADLPYRFLNLRSVAGMYESIDLLGKKYGKEEQAEKALVAYRDTLNELQEIRGDKEGPTVLLLMGFPGSYCEATASSYIGNLVEMAGGKNVIEDASDDFVSWNSERLMSLDPDYILWTSHAMPKKVAEMFDDEFANNDVWKHFTAVKEGRVIALDDSVFHMSANFKWPEALTTLYQIFYGEQVDE